MGCSLASSSIHGIFQARVLEWVAISFSRGSSQPRDWTQVSCIAANALPSEPPGKPRQYIKEQKHHFANKDLSSQGYGLSSGHVQMWEMNNKEGRAKKTWCFRNVMLEKTLENPFDSKEIKPVNPKGNQLWIFIGRIDLEVEAPIGWPCDVKSQLNGKKHYSWNDWRQKEERVTEDEMIGWQGTGKLGVQQSMGLQRVSDWTSQWLNNNQQVQNLWLQENLSTLLRSAFEPLGVFLTFQFSHSVVSCTLRPHGLQHARLLCLSPAPGACSNSWPSSWWCHPTISSLSSPSPPTFTISQEQGLFQWVSSLHQVAKVLEFQL